MLDKEKLYDRLSEFPLYSFHIVKPSELEFSQRVRWICENECPRYGKSWACPPGVGSVEQCKEKCLQYKNCLIISTATEVSDISNIEETLATRPEHERITNKVGELLMQIGYPVYILSTEACSNCHSCAYKDGMPCRLPNRMHPCVESHGINLIPTLESLGLEFHYGSNVVTWFSLLFF